MARATVCDASCATLQSCQVTRAVRKVHDQPESLRWPAVVTNPIPIQNLFAASKFLTPAWYVARNAGSDKIPAVSLSLEIFGHFQLSVRPCSCWRFDLGPALLIFREKSLQDQRLWFWSAVLRFRVDEYCELLTWSIACNSPDQKTKNVLQTLWRFLSADWLTSPGMEAARDMHLTQKEQSEGNLDRTWSWWFGSHFGKFFFAATASQKERVVAAPHLTSAIRTLPLNRCKFPELHNFTLYFANEKTIIKISYTTLWVTQGWKCLLVSERFLFSWV